MDAEADDDAVLAAALRALASPTRLALLRHLRRPHTSTEIRLRPPSGDEGRPQQHLARQTVREHVDILLSLGVVLARPAEREFGATTEYVVNQQAIFALVEDLRALVRLRGVEPIEGETWRGDAAGRAERPRGAHLLLVHGVDEGRVFDVPPDQPEDAPFMIGRRTHADACIDFDPFVSLDNAALWRRGARFEIEDLPSSRNGTSVNFRRLAPGSRHALRSGDVVGVGRSLLVFRDA